MGITLSCPLSKYIDIDNGFGAILMKSLCTANEEAKTLVRSFCYRDWDSRSVIPESARNKAVALEVSADFKAKDKRTAESGGSEHEEAESPTSVISFPQHDAAIKLQKFYKSFRTRRKLADCAVLVQQKWWEVLDSVELNNSSITFFDEGKHETAISRWSRARTRAAKVGKGLSKNDKAQKLTFQHWLEAIDPRHRYGHNLHFYYIKWLQSQSREPFFYWLDVGEGKEANLVDECPRWKLQQQCIKYLGPIERKGYEVSLEGGKFIYKQTGKPLHTIREPQDVKWIFVLSTSKTMYVGRKRKGLFQHSSFLAGGAALAAGQIVVEHGTLKATWPHSGHYRPTAENFRDFLTFLQENDIDLTGVKVNSGLHHLDRASDDCRVLTSPDILFVIPSAVPRRRMLHEERHCNVEKQFFHQKLE
ncbi:hypothetical protein SAY87_017977 [Trapa incisa]|uniref:IQ calmodulin-binding motif family protein n=1 Tax=Trapa incisa TaxID=236973 RepID=A0AAN7L9Y1_9MYRT|nr:hypothetical protein SAY87_017977 [Trapa incisa]